MERCTVISIIELVDTVRTSDKDENRGDAQERQKDLEFPVKTYIGLVDRSAVADAVVNAQADEDEQRADLEAQTSKTDINTGLR